MNKAQDIGILVDQEKTFRYHEMMVSWVDNFLTSFMKETLQKYHTTDIKTVNEWFADNVFKNKITLGEFIREMREFGFHANSDVTGNKNGVYIEIPPSRD